MKTNGITFYKIISPYMGDFTKNCGLTGEEIDANFLFLRGNDIESVFYDKNTQELTARRYNGEEISCPLDDFLHSVTLEGSNFTPESGVLHLFLNGVEFEIPGFPTCDCDEIWKALGEINCEIEGIKEEVLITKSISGDGFVIPEGLNLTQTAEIIVGQIKSDDSECVITRDILGAVKEDEIVFAAASDVTEDSAEYDIVAYKGDTVTVAIQKVVDYLLRKNKELKDELSEKSEIWNEKIQEAIDAVNSEKEYRIAADNEIISGITKESETREQKDNEIIALIDNKINAEAEHRSSEDDNIKAIIEENEQAIATSLNDLNARVNEKQDKLIAGNGISINESNEISATFDASEIENKINTLADIVNENEEVTAASLNDLNIRVEEKQDKLIAGDNIVISGNVISSTADVADIQDQINTISGVTATNVQQITNLGNNIATVSANTGVNADAIETLSGTVVSNERVMATALNDLNARVDEKQGALTAGNGISIENDVISVTGETLWESGEGKGSIIQKIQKGEGIESPCTAKGIGAIASGIDTSANANYSQAEGMSTMTLDSGVYPGWDDGVASHAEGNKTTTHGRASHVEGDGTVANNIGEHAEGRYNVSHFTINAWGNSGNTIHSVGIGTESPDLYFENSKNAFEIMQNGDAYMIGVGGYEGNEIESASTIQEVISSKQDSIEDIEEIRSGAASAATALQPSDIVDNLESTDATKVLSAKQGSQIVNYVNQQIAGDESKIVNVETATTPTEGYLKTYVIKQGGTEIGKIDIPMDYFVKSAEIVENPSGQTPGKYIKLIINTEDESGEKDPIFLNITEIGKTYSQGNGIVISGTNEISIDPDKMEKWDAAEENVQADWNETDENSDAYINNKPTDLVHTNELTPITESIESVSDRVEILEGAGFITDDAISGISADVRALSGASNDIENRVGAIESDYVKSNDISGITALGEAVAALQSSSHTHANGDILSSISESAVEAWDWAVDEASGHTAQIANLADEVNTLSSNVSTIQSDITSLAGNAHTHSNKELLDTYTQTEENLADAVLKRHEHENIDALSAISLSRIEAWDAAAGGEAVQADWAENESESPSYIKNKPENLVQDSTYAHITVTENSVSDGINTFTKYDDTELVSEIESVQNEVSGISDEITAINTRIDGIQDDYVDHEDLSGITNDIVDLQSSAHTHDNANVLSGISLEDVNAWNEAEKNVQADWGMTDSTSDAYIKNKPENLVQDVNYKHIIVTENSVSDGITTFEQYDDTDLQNEITSLSSQQTNINGRVGAIEGDYLKALDKVELETEIASGDMAVKNVIGGEYTSANTVASAIAAINTSAHTHNNKAVLDGIGETDVANWDGAHVSAHTHGNKTLLDTYTQTETNLADAVAKKHSHTNLDVLGIITSAKTQAWDDAEENAISASTVQIVSAITGDYAKVYAIKQGGEELGTIDIPKDMVVSSGEIVDVDDIKYLRLNIANTTNHVDIDVADLAQVYSAGDAIGITNENVINVKVNAANGLSISNDKISMALANAQNAGAMSAADKASLDNIKGEVSTLSTDITNLQSSAHTHNNASVLEGITTAKTAQWDAAEANVQADWNETDENSDTYIKDKPENLVQDSAYAHITVTENSVSDGTTTFNKYDDTAIVNRVADLEDCVDIIDKVTSAALVDLDERISKSELRGITGITINDESAVFDNVGQIIFEDTDDLSINVFDNGDDKLHISFNVLGILNSQPTNLDDEEEEI